MITLKSSFKSIHFELAFDAIGSRCPEFCSTKAHFSGITYILYLLLSIFFEQAELHEKEQVVLNNQRRRAIKVYKNLEKLRTRMNDDDQVKSYICDHIN